MVADTGSIYKNQLYFLFTNNEQFKKEIKKKFIYNRIKKNKTGTKLIKKCKT